MLKEALIQSLHRFSGLLPLSLLQQLSRQRLLPVFYHTVSDQPLPHIQHLYKVRSSALFIQDLDYLLQHFQPIHLSQLIDFVHEGTPLPRNSFLLTFDDGLSQCFDIIAPILKQKGVPATFFLNSDFVDNKALMFRYKASLLIEHLLKHPFSAEILQQQFAKYNLLYEQVKKNFLSVRWPEQQLLDDIAVLVGLDFEVFLQEKEPYLKKEQIKQMMADGFTFGSHSKNHPTYHKIKLEDQVTQTIQSQEYLNKEFDIPYKAFAFPFTDSGVSKAFFDQILAEQQFQLTFGGAGLKQEIIKGQIQRFGMETQQQTSAKQLIHSEYCYYIMKAFLGKNRIVRR